MTGIARRQRIRLLLLASAVGAMMIPAGTARAEDDLFAAGNEAPPVYSHLPEIEIDGSVLEHLGKNLPGASAIAQQPVQLVPPPEIAAQSLATPTLTNPEFAAPPAPAKTGSPTLTATTGEDGSPTARAAGNVHPVIREIPAPPTKPVLTTKGITAEPLPPLKTAVKPVIRELPAPEKKPVAIVPDQAKQEKIAAIPAPATTPFPPLPGIKPQAPISIAKVDIIASAQETAAIQPTIKNESEMKISAQTVHSLIEEITNIPLEQTAVEQPQQAPPAPVIAAAVPAAKEIRPPKPGDNITGSKAFENIHPPEPGTIAMFPIKVKVKDKQVIDPIPVKDAVTVAKNSAPAVQPVAPAAIQPVIRETLAQAPSPSAERMAAIVAPEKGPIKVWNNTAVAVEPVILGPAPVFNIPEQKIAQQDIADHQAPPVPVKKPAPASKVEAQQEPLEQASAVDTAPPEPDVIAATTLPEVEKKEEWRQESPAVVIKADVPVPARRPEKQMASQEFVQQARRTVMETYTVMRNDGAPMPVIEKADITQENLPAIRMSVEDLANDPLASKLMDMTPEEVAASLSRVAPAAGRQLSRELNAVSKPRIVRQEGERIYKSRRNLEPVYESAQHQEQTSPAAVAPEADQQETPSPAPVAMVPETNTIKGERLDLALPFPVGIVDLPEDAKMHMDNGVIPVLKSRDGMRIQIVAFASPTEGKEASARRTALSRALAVRSYLISQGVDATRMDVRALGVQTDPQAGKDKVDLHLVMPEKI